MATSKRRLAVILFADIQGYTAMMEQNEKEASDVIRRFQSEVETLVTASNGKVINFFGDGGLCTFDDPVDAAQSAIRMQQSFREDPAIPVRIGIHSGTVIFEEGKIFGNSVNVTSRIESMSVPGAVLLSRKVRDELKNHPEFSLTSLGEFEFKNVEEPIEVFALAGEGLVVPDPLTVEGKFKQEAGDPYSSGERSTADKWFAWGLQILGGLVLLAAIGYAIFFRSDHANAKTQTVTFINADGEEETRTFLKKEFQRSLLVFPFEQQGGDSVDAVTGAALAFGASLDLSQDKYLDAKAFLFIPGTQNSDFSTVDKVNQSRSFSDDHYLDGSFRYENGTYSITPVVHDKQNGSPIAERTFQGSDYSFLIDSISRFVKEAVGLSQQQISETIDLGFREMITQHPKAFLEFVKGYRERNLRLIEDALERDSTFALASYYHAYFSYNQSSIEAVYSIRQAMRHRKRLPYIWQIEILSDHHLMTENWDKAEQLLRTQLEIDPTDFETLNSLSKLYMMTGQLEKMYQIKKREYELTPGGIKALEVANAAIINGQHKQAALYIQEVLDVDPRNIFALQLLAEIHTQQGDYPAAREVFENIMLFNPDIDSLIQIQLSALDYLEGVSEYPKWVPKVTGTYRLGSGMTFFIREINGVLFNRAENQAGFFTYPSGKWMASHGGVTHGFVAHFQLDSLQTVSRIQIQQYQPSGESIPGYAWRYDSLVRKAESLLENKEYPAALEAYDRALARHPDHFYLRDARDHVQYMLKSDPQQLESRLKQITGKYGEARFWLEDGRLVYKRKGLGRRIFLPVSDNRFITLQSYQSSYEFLEKDGKPIAVTAFHFDPEKEEWARQMDWYYEKEEFLN